MPEQTPSQTIGPFYALALPYPDGPFVVPVGSPGSIRLHGTVFDGEGEPIPDALVETWQADAAGEVISVRGSLHRSPYENTGFGRVETDRDGHWEVTTVKPGSVGGAAPYILVTVFARGLLHHLFTRAYFPDEPDANRADPLLSRLPAERRDTLVAVADGERGYRFDIRLQGLGETVFLDFGGVDV